MKFVLLLIIYYFQYSSTSRIRKNILVAKLQSQFSKIETL